MSVTDCAASLNVAVVQMWAGPEPGVNRERAARLVQQAVAGGAEFVALPELFSCLGDLPALRAAAEPLDGLTSEWASRLAAQCSIHLLSGSFVEFADRRYYNTSCLWGPGGERLAIYRKIHLFDNDVPEATFRESELITAGDEVVVADIAGVGVGLTICYDLRFPELYRAIALEGARVVCVPSAFMHATGRHHWHPLVRARAIENALFVLAPNQPPRPPGSPGPNSALCCYGHSLIVDAWGNVLAEGQQGEEVITAELNFVEQDDIRRMLACLDQRRLDVY